jgi:hypothetical protein
MTQNSKMRAMGTQNRIQQQQNYQLECLPHPEDLTGILYLCSQLDPQEAPKARLLSFLVEDHPLW